MSDEELGSATSVSISDEAPEATTDEAPEAISDEAPEAISDEPVAPEIAAEEPKRKLDISVNITDVGPCKKHLKVTIPRGEIDREFEESLESLRKEALVPGFRMGRAPRQLVIKRFRKQVSDKVKSNLLMMSLEQIDQDYKLEPITQPRLELDAIEIPEKGPMNFEMDIEVRPQFEVPKYTGLKIKRPVANLTDNHVDEQLSRFLEGHGQVVPKLEGAAELGDYLTADVLFIRPDGKHLNESKEVQFRLRRELRFNDGTIGDTTALLGAKPGDTRELTAKLGSSVVDAALRGTTTTARFTINDLKRIRLPELNQEFLDSIDIDTPETLRAAVRATLEARIQAEQRQTIRRQIVDHLLKHAPFDLPSELVSREEKGTIDRLVGQLVQQGMSESEIRARQAEIRANAHETTRRTLKEILVLSRIADLEGITVGEGDLALEIEAIAARTGESARRIRSRAEKEGGADSLVNQILEQKVISFIFQAGDIEDVAVQIEPEGQVEALDISATVPAGESSAPPDEGPKSEKPEPESS